MHNRNPMRMHEISPTASVIRIGIVAGMILALGYERCLGALDSETAQARRDLKAMIECQGAGRDVQFDDEPGNRTVTYRANTGTRGERADRACMIQLVTIVSVTADYATIPATGSGAYGIKFFDYNSDNFNGEGKGMYRTSLSKSAAEAAARALKFLAIQTQRERDVVDATKLEEFKKQAKAWRELPTKPTMPEEARRHKVLAENAFREKDFTKASEEYGAALKIFPCWPEGQFNLALISGETKSYRSALLHMKCYLELAPNAPNAEPARDKLIIWEDKIKPKW